MVTLVPRVGPAMARLASGGVLGLVVVSSGVCVVGGAGVLGVGAGALAGAGVSGVLVVSEGEAGVAASSGVVLWKVRLSGPFASIIAAAIACS